MLFRSDALGSIALVPIGFAVIGPIADAVGTREALLGAAFFILAATLPVFGVRDVRELRRR